MVDARAASSAVRGTFERFVADHELSLRRALVASYGAVVGREAAVDALSWGWEHWGRVSAMENPAGYLYRVGQTRARVLLAQRAAAKSDRPDLGVEHGEVAPELWPALARLSVQQRAAVVLVHGYGLSQRAAATALKVTVSTLRVHLERAMTQLRAEIGDQS
jgi:RNA polymerase sigma-70 factor (ECF subfamily)